MFASISSLPSDELYQKAIFFKEAKDYDNYIIHMTMAANLNHRLAIEYLFKDYRDERLYEKQDYSKTIKFYETTLEYGFSASYLAWMFEKGKGVKRDYNKAIELYQVAIEKGNSTAMNNLALMYDMGTGVSKDYDQAVKFYKMAIEKGNSTAMYNLADMYEMGIVEFSECNRTNCKQKNYDLMKKYYLMAINNDEPDATFRLRHYYMNNQNDLSIIEVYDNKQFHSYATDIINTIFQNNRELPEQYKQQFANLRFDAGIHETVKMKQIILKKTNIWPSKYDSKYLLHFMELLSVSSSNNKCLTKDVILYIAGCLFV